MMISGYKTKSVFERFNIISDNDLRRAAQKQEGCLETQNGYKTVQSTSSEKNGLTKIAVNPLNRKVFSGAGRRNRTIDTGIFSKGAQRRWVLLKGRSNRTEIWVALSSNTGAG
jgi:hypothetical protein